MNYIAEARTVAEALRVKEAQTFNEDMATKNFEMREKQFEEQMRAAGVSEDLAAKGFDLKKRAADLAHTKAVVDMIPSSLLGALSGDKGKAVPIGSNATVAVSKKFTANYNTQLTKQEQCSLICILSLQDKEMMDLHPWKKRVNPLRCRLSKKLEINY